MKNTKRFLPLLAVIFMVVMAAMPIIAFADGEAAAPTSWVYGTPLALLPPVIAIVLALITKKFDLIATLIPLVMFRPLLTLAEITKRKGE